MARDQIAKGLPSTAGHPPKIPKTRIIPRTPKRAKQELPTDQESLIALARLAENPQLLYCRGVPTPKQKQFLDAANASKRVLYGGAAGGGKSYALLLAALQHVQNPFYSCLILRRTLQDLRLAGALIDMAHRWLDSTDAKWDGQTYTWRFPRGAIIQFGYLETPQDKYRYQSAQYHTICIDEASQIDPQDIVYLTSRLRTNINSKLPPERLLLASNPGGKSHSWLYEKFVNPTTRAKGYEFVSASYTDNPHIDHESYGETLDALPDIYRRQLKLGEWVEDGESTVYRITADNIIKELPKSGRVIIGLDLGWHDDTAIVILRQSEEKVYVEYVDTYNHQTISETADKLKLLIDKYQPERIVVDTGGGGKLISEELRARHRIPCSAAIKTNKVDNIALLNDDLAKEKLLIHVSCKPLIKQLQALQWKNSKHREEHPNQENHLCDALLYAWRESTHWITDPNPKNPNEEDLPAWAIHEPANPEKEEYGPMAEIYKMD
jgi:PBSX family phage terminase large subunit